MRSHSKNPIIVTLLWHVSLYKKVISVTSSNTVQAVNLSVASRIFYLLSFLLPLKAIMLASAPYPPEFLVRLYPSITVNDLVLTLGTITVIFYLGNISFLRLIEIRIDRGAKQIIARTQKVGASLNVYDETKRSYDAVVRSLSSLLFYLVVSVALILLYPKLFLAFSSVLIVPWLVVVWVFEYPRGALRHWLSANRRVLQQHWMFFVFITIFIVIVFDILSADVELSAILALVSFILCRYALSAANEFINTAFKLYSLRTKVNNLLFFTSPEAYSQLAEQKVANNTLLTSEHAHRLAQTLVQRLEPGPDVLKEVLWRPINVYGAYGFDLHLTDAKVDAALENGRFLLKVFQQKYKSVADHERLLLDNLSSAILPAPELVATDMIDNFECTLLQWPGAPVRTLSEYKSGVISILGDIWAIDTSINVLSAYGRSHKCGIEKLERFQVESLSPVCFDEKKRGDLTDLIRRLDEVKEYVMALPKALHNPELTMNVVSITDEQRPVVAQWGRWSLEPIGTALWYFDFIDGESLGRIIECVKEKRTDCRDLEQDQLRLNGELYKLWRLIGKQKLSDALIAAGNVLEIYKRLNCLDRAHCG